MNIIVNLCTSLLFISELPVECLTFELVLDVIPSGSYFSISGFDSLCFDPGPSPLATTEVIV